MDTDTSAPGDDMTDLLSALRTSITAAGGDPKPRTPADRRFSGVKLNRTKGIFQLSTSWETNSLGSYVDDISVHQRMIIIAPSADVARTMAADYARTRAGEAPVGRWLDERTEVVVIGLAERSQPLGLVAKSGDWS